MSKEIKEAIYDLYCAYMKRPCFDHEKSITAVHDYIKSIGHNYKKKTINDIVCKKLRIIYG